MGQDNLLNAIYCEGEVSFTNVTYWGANGITNTDQSATSPKRSNKEAGQNITVTIVVNDILILNTTKVTDENGTIILDLIAGNYTITACHNTDSYYTQAEKSETFNTGIGTILKLNASENIVTATITPKDTQGNVTFIVKNESGIVKTIEKALNNGVSELNLSGLLAGKYNITATYWGNINYSPSQFNMTYEKIKLDSAIVIEAANITTDQSEIINITVNGAKDKNITVHVNDNEYNITNGTLTLTGLSEGIYTVTVFWKGDVDYKEVSNSTRFWAIKNIQYYVNITSISTNSRTVNITAKSNIPNDIIQGKLQFILQNSTKINANYNNNGTWWAVHTFEDYGDYNITAHYNNLDGVIVNNATISLRADVPINVSDITISYGDDAEIVASVPEAINGQNLTITVNGISKNATVKNGKANTTFTGISAGEYAITVEYSGDSHNSANSTTAKLTVNKFKTQLTANAVTTTYNVNKNLVITLKDSKGNPLSGASVCINLNGVKYYTTDKNGQVKVNVAKLVPKTYTAKITFNGNSNYQASSAAVKVTVKKAKSKITAKKKTFKKAKKVKKYTITLKSGKTPIKKVKVTLKIKKKTYKAKTNKKGKAVFKIKNLKKKGTFKATIKFKGNKYYKKATKTIKIKIK